MMRMSGVPLKQIAGIVLLLFLAVLIRVNAEGKEIVDMAGRRVLVPDNITKVYGASPPATYLLYAVAPTVIAGLNYSFTSNERKYLRPGVDSLPVIGGWFGQGRTPNQETLLKVKPDVMVVWMWKGSAANEKIEQVAEQLGLPLAYVRIDHLSDYPEAFLFMGHLVGMEERARKLSDYAICALDGIGPVVAAIPEEKKVSVYYAEAPDGLSTECDNSPHTELINLAGGRNIYRCTPKDDFGMERISIEQIMLADPEIILAQEKEYVDHVYSDPRWQSIRAVKNRRVHLIPRAPFNWFDRPPCFMRLLGIKWLTNLLYPDLYPLDLAREAREFYSLFLGVELDDKALREVLHQ